MNSPSAIRCKPWVPLRYLPAYRLNDACESFTRIVCRDDPPEFVEGILYGRDRSVIITGDFVECPDNAKVRPVVQTLVPQNLFFPFIYNAWSAPSGSRALPGVSSTLIAGAAMSFSSVSVIGNALRLAR